VNEGEVRREGKRGKERKEKSRLFEGRIRKESSKENQRNNAHTDIQRCPLNLVGLVLGLSLGLT
jgi:hypothetical protein